MPVYIKRVHIQDTIKEKAFAVLVNKCNVCHAKKKKLIIFTPSNMDSFYKSINEQVFIKKRMPKGKKNTLSTIEKEYLKIWIQDLN